MKLAFVGKVIRCRRCKSPFRVMAVQSPAAIPEAAITATPTPWSRLRTAATWQELVRRATHPHPDENQASTIFEDIGDVLDELVPVDRVASVVRPKKVGVDANQRYESLAFLVAIGLGAACSLPIALFILWYGFDTNPIRIGQALPDWLEWVAPPRFRD